MEPPSHLHHKQKPAKFAQRIQDNGQMFNANDWNVPRPDASTSAGGGGYYQQQHVTNAYGPTFGGNMMQPDNAFASPFPQQMLSEPMLNMAEQYGKQFAEQQKEKMSQYVSVDKLKYYFAVDNAYVGKKLALLLFPFAHRHWSVQFASSAGGAPVAPRYDVNAPDLYIPLMAIITYVLVAAFALGTQNRFSPEQLGMLTSNVTAWFVAENVMMLITKYLMDISQALSFWHCLALSSYKFVGMTLSVVCFVLAGKTVYYGVLAYCAVAISFFLMRSIKSFVLDSSTEVESGRRRKLYLVLFISLTQPVIMWWLTSQIAAYAVVTNNIVPGMGQFPVPMAPYNNPALPQGEQVRKLGEMPKMGDIAGTV